MMSSDEWQRRVVEDGLAFCPECESQNLTMGACAVGAITVHQEYVCEDCQFEFKALYCLTAVYPA